MPTRQSKKGKLTWLNPTVEEQREFLNQLDECTFNKDLDLVFRERTANLTSSLVMLSNRLSNNNIKTREVITRIAKEGLGWVDIVVPVHNSVHITLECLDSIVKNTSWPYKIYIVNDASDEYTRQKLALWASRNNAELVHNKKNKGFPASVNRGVRLGGGKYVCVHNSDVLVTEGWLTKMVMAIESDEKAMIVNPCTNNTALIDVPMVPGTSYLDMNRAVERTSHRRYPEIMPTGFCFFTYRSLFNELGYFDEAYGRGYGEETDWWMRTITRLKDGEFKKWKAVLADDTYLFHERGSSFSAFGEAEKMVFRKAGADRFHKMWPGYRNWAEQFNVADIMKPLRTTFDHRQLIAEDSRYNIAFIVHSVGFCGGMKMICDIVNHLIDNNVNAKVIHIKRNIKDRSIPLGELRTAPIVFNTAEEAIQNFNTVVFSKGVVVAGSNELAGFVKQICDQSPNLTSVLYAQSHDPLIAKDKQASSELGRGFKLVDHIITNAKWLSKDVKRSYRLSPVGFVRPGIDLDIFYPGDREDGDDRQTVMFYFNNSAPYRGTVRGAQLATALLERARSENKDLRILAYGVDGVEGVQEITCLGQIPQVALAKKLRSEVDLFIDPSHLHTYGMPSLEALVSGVPVVSWDNKGIHEYATNNENAIILEQDAEVKDVTVAVWNLLANPGKLKALKEGALTLRHSVPSRKDACILFQDVLEKAVGLKLLPSRKIAVITPHLRKFGGPTTLVETANGLAERGHDVTMYSIYSDLAPSVLNSVKVPIRLDWTMIEADVAIVNSDNPGSPKILENPDIRKKIMLKLSHNPRFFDLENESLKLPWDKIVTSTQWLADVCQKPEDKWDYQPREATKVGWFHYGHQQFARQPQEKTHNILGRSPINIGTLVHAHPLKGSEVALNMLYKIKEKFGEKVNILGVGEVTDFKNQCPGWMQYFLNLKRDQMASFMSQCDIWVCASQTEGLGRLALEAMSAGCVVVTYDTGAEFAATGKNCLVVPQGNVDALESEVARIMVDIELRKKISLNAFATAEHYADKKQYIDNWVKIIEEVLQ